MQFHKPLLSGKKERADRSTVGASKSLAGKLSITKENTQSLLLRLGDRLIETIQTSPIKPRTIDIAFGLIRTVDQALE